jgi:hypothetical protein
MTTLNVNPENVLRLILLAREFHAQDSVPMGDEPVNQSDEGPRHMLTHRAGDLTLEEFRSIIADLEPKQQAEVVALMWVGRGDYEAEEWESVREEAREQWTPWTADYLIAHPLLPHYLTEGLDALGYDHEE